ncbi:MAG: hypothetical protein Harvfovirus7_3 [Harvfovirus sp.]|uniref:Uncharacterized protein n=1 Tax=Harvfovirus sp. TaxID=2487768 RepID=A0A3G5A0Q6_9VIRU|nr:MAG: hypothetical protein Harvfovirus7_3 [Harvfovirus sp.]
MTTLYLMILATNVIASVCFISSVETTNKITSQIAQESIIDITEIASLKPNEFRIIRIPSPLQIGHLQCKLVYNLCHFPRFSPIYNPKPSLQHLTTIHSPTNLQTTTNITISPMNNCQLSLPNTYPKISEKLFGNKILLDIFKTCGEIPYLKQSRIISPLKQYHLYTYNFNNKDMFISGHRSKPNVIKYNRYGPNAKKLIEDKYAKKLENSLFKSVISLSLVIACTTIGIKKFKI